MSLGTEVNVLPSAIASARAHGGLVIVQANVQMPYTYGDAQNYEHEIDYLVEVDETLPAHERGDLGDVERAIGNRIVALVEPNSTLQLGIGAVPDAVLAADPQQGCASGRRCSAMGCWMYLREAHLMMRCH